jgi:hypothetical protein
VVQVMRVVRLVQAVRLKREMAELVERAAERPASASYVQAMSPSSRWVIASTVAAQILTKIRYRSPR